MRAAKRAVAWSAAAAITALAAVGCTIPAALPSHGASTAHQPATASGRVISLTSISTLRALFNRADGHARLVLIFSPT